MKLEQVLNHYEVTLKPNSTATFYVVGSVVVSASGCAKAVLEKQTRFTNSSSVSFFNAAGNLIVSNRDTCPQTIYIDTETYE